MDDRDALQQELQHTRLAYQSALTLARWKSEFLGRAAHELRAPLGSLISLHQLILADLCESPEEEREFLTRARQSAGKLLEMLDEIIAVSKLESGRIALDIQPVSLARLLQDLERLTRLLAANRNVTLEIAPLPEEIYLSTDVQRICHALVFLVDAAIACRERETLRLSGETTDPRTVAITIEIPGSLALESEIPLLTPECDLEEVERWNQSLSLSPRLKFEIARHIIHRLDGQLSYREMTAADGAGQITRIECFLPRSPSAGEVPTDRD